MAPNPLKTTALASMLLATATGQNVILVPSLLSPLSPHEPPCRQRRLEPFRQDVRDSCKAEISACSLSAEDRPLKEALDFFPSDVRRFLDGFSAMPPSSSVVAFDRDPWDQVFDDMMRQSMAIFDAMLDRDSPPLSLPMDQGNAREAGEVKSGEVTKQQDAERAAEQALDVMVTSLFSNVANEGANNNNKVENKGREITHRLSQRGNDLLMRTHRRLAEQSRLESVDPHSAVQERLARRLTEYSVDLFFHPDGTVTLYSTAMPSPPGNDVPVLGSGSKEVDHCVYSRYENGDLENECDEAVDFFMMALSSPGMQYDQLNTVSSDLRSLEQKSQSIESHPPFMGNYQVSLIILMVIYALVAILGLCTGFIDAWTFVMGIFLSVSVSIWGFVSLIVSLPICLLFDRFLISVRGEHAENPKDESDVTEDYDYVKLADSEDDHGENDANGAVKESQTLVFVGVPVHVV